jgi:hypothetical protein
MRKTRRRPIKRKPRRFFPGANVAIDDIDLPELEDWMVGCGK